VCEINKRERRELYCSASPSRDGTQRAAQAERSDWGVGWVRDQPDWERGDFRRRHSLHNDNDKVGQIQAGRGEQLMELGVHAGEWSGDIPV
jgi:hypothetical protein